MAKKHHHPYTKPSPPTPERADPDLLVFQLAQKLAADSTIAQLTEAAADLGGEREVHQKIRSVRETLERLHRANGATGSFTNRHVQVDGPSCRGGRER